MAHKNVIFQMIAGLLLLAAILGYLGTTQSFHHCSSAIKHTKEYDGYTGEIEGFFGLFYRVINRLHLDAACEVVAVDKHNGFFSVFASCIIAWFTVSLTRATVGLQRASDDQGKAMTASIAEAARAASAMESVAKGIRETVQINKVVIENQKDFWARQMRAYVSVDIGNYIRQNGKIRFEFRPNIVNNGTAPAKNVRVLSKSRLCDGVPDDFDFVLVAESIKDRSTTSLSPRQSKFHGNVFERKINRAEMRNVIKWNLGFHVWGQVVYEDIFSMTRVTNFSFMIQPPGDKRVGPIWRVTDKHNDAT